MASVARLLAPGGRERQRRGQGVAPRAGPWVFFLPSLGVLGACPGGGAGAPPGGWPLCSSSTASGRGGAWRGGGAGGSPPFLRTFPRPPFAGGGGIGSETPFRGLGHRGRQPPGSACRSRSHRALSACVS